MNSKELRQKFLKFFEERGHKIVPSSSLIPENDPSVLFTTAGMQQFKLYYTGKLNPFSDKHFALGEPLNTYNVASCQKCLRTTDIDSVGDESHLTFFEMLGNFSFGGYFKEEALKYGLEFIIKVLNVPLSRVKTTVFGGDKEVPFDEESYKVLLKLGIPKDKIIKGTRNDNFWGPTGEEGPCGPTAEIYVDDIEIWNLVFNEYYMHPDKSLEPLKTKGVDTGMGLERLALVIQYPRNGNKEIRSTVFDTDLFNDLMKYLREQSCRQEDERNQRIIADHLRASVFLAAAGVEPSNLERGYILRRLIRRFVCRSQIIGLKEGWLGNAIAIVINKYKDFYTELNDQNRIQKTIKIEIEKFRKSLQRGLKEWQKLLSDVSKQKGKIISGEKAFHLYESYGFPLELIQELAEEKGLVVDKKTFQKEFERHQKVSRAGQEKKFGGHGIEKLKIEREKIEVIKLHTATHLLLQALRDILGSNITQRGSDINTERLRLDFTFDRKLTPEELKKIEDLVNQKIKENRVVTHYDTSYEKAISQGALGSFKERYPKKITVYEIKKENTGEVWSKEICAGPHVQRTKEIGKFKISKQEAVAYKVRRIKAIVE